MSPSLFNNPTSLLRVLQPLFIIDVTKIEYVTHLHRTTRLLQALIILPVKSRQESVKSPHHVPFTCVSPALKSLLATHLREVVCNPQGSAAQICMRVPRLRFSNSKQTTIRISEGRERDRQCLNYSSGEAFSDRTDPLGSALGLGLGLDPIADALAVVWRGTRRKAR